MARSSIVLDTNVVISMIERPGVASGIRAGLRGKPATIILCDVVLGELRRVRGYTRERAVRAVSGALGKRVVISQTTRDHASNARKLTERFETCHAGDNKILSICQMEGHILLTYDGKLLRAGGLAGVVVFHPSNAKMI